MTATAVLDLERAGFSREQVEALARYLDTQAATRADLLELGGELRAEIAEAKADVIKWVVGAGLAQVLALVGAVLAIVRFLPGGPP